MNTAETMRMLTDKDPATGDYRIPRIIYSDAYYSETVAYADLVLPDTTYLERWDCISLLDRPIGGVDGPGDAIRQPVVEPDRDVRPFQDVLIELGARLGLPGFTTPDGAAALSRRLSRLHRQPRAPAGGRAVGRLARRRRRPARPRRAEPASARTLHRQWLLLEARAAGGPALFQARQPGLSRNRGGDGVHRLGAADRPAALCRAIAALSPRRPGARSGGAAARAPRAHRHLFRPAAVLVHAVRGSAGRSRGLPAARADPAADADVPFLAFAECLAAPDPRLQPAVHQPDHRARAGPRRGGLGLGHQPSRADPRPDAG